MKIVHYSAGMDADGKIAMVPVSYDQLQQTMPIAVAPSHPAFGSAMPLANAPVTAQPEPKPEPVRGIPIPVILIGGLLCFLVLNPGNSSGPTISELKAENQYLNQKVSELQHQLIGVYSAE